MEELASRAFSMRLAAKKLHLTKVNKLGRRGSVSTSKWRDRAPAALGVLGNQIKYSPRKPMRRNDLLLAGLALPVLPYSFFLNRNVSQLLKKTSYFLFMRVHSCLRLWWPLQPSFPSLCLLGYSQKAPLQKFRVLCLDLVGGIFLFFICSRTPFQQQSSGVSLAHCTIQPFFAGRPRAEEFWDTTAISRTRSPCHCSRDSGCKFSLGVSSRSLSYIVPVILPVGAFIFHLTLPREFKWRISGRCVALFIA